MELLNLSKMLETKLIKNKALGYNIIYPLMRQQCLSMYSRYRQERK